MRLCIDSSALAKRYISEPGTPALLARCRAAREIILSTLCLPEVLSGLNRLRRDGSLSDERYQRLKADVLADLDEATRIDVDADVLRQAVICLENASIRTLDAIHVASALKSGCDAFLSADRRQCRAAGVLGLRVIDFSYLG